MTPHLLIDKYLRFSFSDYDLVNLIIYPQIQEEVSLGAVGNLMEILSYTYSEACLINSFTGEIIPKHSVAYSFNKQWASTVCQQLCDIPGSKDKMSVTLALKLFKLLTFES